MPSRFSKDVTLEESDVEGADEEEVLRAVLEAGDTCCGVIHSFGLLWTDGWRGYTCGLAGAGPFTLCFLISLGTCFLASGRDK